MIVLLQQFSLYNDWEWELPPKLLPELVLLLTLPLPQSTLQLHLQTVFWALPHQLDSLVFLSKRGLDHYTLRTIEVLKQGLDIIAPRL